jgi:hypothetical protein
LGFFKKRKKNVMTNEIAGFGDLNFYFYFFLGGGGGGGVI